MIIENLQKSDIQTIGDIQQIKASIDVKNIEFITTLLSSNLYSNPMQSFIREIVSNAWDSHVEANNTNEPVIVRLTRNDVSIRDYGTGLSKEDFEELYCKIGSSSKRLSNNYIGCFGIGHLSMMAVSDVGYVTSYYNGKERNYVMVKENGTITTNYLGESDTKEHNGLLVRVPISILDIEKAKRALESLVFFPNIYVDYQVGIDGEANINEAKVVRYKNFSVASILRQWRGQEWIRKTWVLLGNVLYPLELGKLTYQFNDSQLRALKECNICLNVNIGEINVTPNRESIIYSEKTIEVLSNKLGEALTEIENIIKAKSVSDCNTIKDYYKNIKSTYYWNPLSGDLTENSSGTWPCKINSLLRGQKKSEDFDKVLSCLGGYLVPGFTKFRWKGTYYTYKGLPWGLRNDEASVLGEQFVTFEDGRNLGGYAKKLVEDTPSLVRACFINRFSKEGFTSDILAHSPYNYVDKTKILPEVFEVVDELYFWYETHIITIKVKEIEDYKAEVKANQPKESRKVDNSLYSLHEYDCDNNIPINRTLTDEPVKFPYIIKKLQKVGKGILHNGKLVTREQFQDYKTLQHLGYTIIWCSNNLYCKLIKYLASKPSQKHLNNIVINYLPLLETLDKTSECKLVLGRYLTQTFTELGNDFYFKDALREIASYLPNSKEIQPILANTELNSYCYKNLVCNTRFKDYKIKHPYAVWLQNYLNRFYVVALKYQTFKNRLDTDGIKTEYAKKPIAAYLMYRWCFKNRILLNLKAYSSLKIKELIKLLYE